MSGRKKALDVASIQGKKKRKQAHLTKKFILSIDNYVKKFLAGVLLNLIIEILYWLNWPWKKWISRLVDRLVMVKEGQP